MKQRVNKYSYNVFRLLVMAVGFGIFACLLWSFTSNQITSEKLLGLTFDDKKNEVTVTVTSTGCTDKNDIQFKVKNNVIEISRKKRDLCKRMPFAVSFTFTLKEAGLDANKSYIIKNKFVAFPQLYVAKSK